MAQHRAGAQWRTRAGDHRMDGDDRNKGRDKAVVLASTDGLSKALHESTSGGKKRLDGLYLPDGRKAEANTNKRSEGGAGSTEEVKANSALSKVARAYDQRQRHKVKYAERTQKTEQDVEDEESAKKAMAILDASTEHEKIMYRDLFDFFDVDKDRTWGSIEFAQRMTDIGYGTSVESASNLLYFAGVRDVDRITFHDFVQLMPKLKAFRKVLEKDAMRAFQAKDIYRKGWISSIALRELLVAMSGPGGFSEEQIKSIVKAADRERTDRISWEFFIRAMFGSPPLIDYELPSAAASFKHRFCLCSRAGMPDDSDEDTTDTRL